MTKRYVDIAIIIPLEEELVQFQKVFPVKENLSTSDTLRHLVSNEARLEILVTSQAEMGRQAATNSFLGLLEDFRIGTVISLGIAGSLSPDVALADVCYTGALLDVYDNSKVIDAEAGSILPEFSPTTYDTAGDLTQSLGFIRTQPELSAMYNKWCHERGAAAGELIPEEYVGHGGKLERIGPPKTKNGVLVCGAVSKSEEYNQKVRQINRRVLALETESGGIFPFALKRGISAISIRGISDYANKQKNALEDQLKGRMRVLAALNAASFLSLQLNNRWFVDNLRNRQDKGGNGQSISLPPRAPIDLSKILSDNNEYIYSRLGEISPEYKLKPKGYVLPIPRIRKVEKEGMDEYSFGIPMEVGDALRQERSILLTIPRTYPDISLPWTIASQLTNEEINGKVVLPIVLDGSTIKPPKGTIERVSSVELAAAFACSGCEIIFVVENFPLSSRTRRSFLLSEMKKLDNSRWVFVCREDLKIISESDFASDVTANIYRACDISFMEIAHFMQKNFSMTMPEAEVVAFRLRDTFSKFDLSAHPTYFAGIPKETLFALLQANRRAELIQLAVDGFLTFIVADDSSDVPLSRTTRARFLRELVLAINLEKRKFTRSQIIEFVEDFAAENDFDIDPIVFIQAFINKGILQFHDEKLRIPLPFIESYLLASELVSKPDKSESYFNFNIDDFDSATFDIYAELGASPKVVERLMAELENCLRELDWNATKASEHVLLSEKLNPAGLGHPDKMRLMQRRLRKAAKDVIAGTGDVREKQKLLDLADKIRDEASRETSLIGVQPEGDKADSLLQATGLWYMGVILLGSGAEHLSAEVKRRLAKLLLDVASAVTHGWTVRQKNVDFDSIKKDLISEESIANFERDILNGDRDVTIPPRTELKNFVETMVDLLEFAAVSTPFKRILSVLCEQAHHRVLAISLDNVAADGPVGELFRSTWLLDVDRTRGKEPFKRMAKALPNSPLLRINLATHLLFRAYWSHSELEDRRKLLDAAEQALSPLSVRVNKEQVLREIELTVDPDPNALE